MIGRILEFLARVRRLLGHPPAEVLRLVTDYASRRVAEARERWRDRFSPTHPADGDIPPGPIGRVIAPIDPGALLPWKAAILAAANEALAHRFDLLGSGPVVVEPGAKYAGLEGHRYDSPPGPVNDTNRGMEKRIRKLISPGYRPIDWHVDFRSGYRWPSDVPSPQIAYGRDPGADVKFPWELARLQHAPSLAFAYAIANAGEGPKAARRFLLEFQDEVLDFIAANPPRFGCNWSCAMDVGIRVANWLAAYDLFRGFGATFDAAFETELKRSVVAHGRHIVNNLEWFPQLRSNHYLANIAGLLFAGAYLPRTRETDAWLWLGAAELAKEICEQFQPDGSSFEASTSYHRLSGEMALWAVAFAHGARGRISALDAAAPDATVLGHRGPGVLPAELAQGRPAELLGERLAAVLSGIAGFTRAITRPDGEVVQVGDNDSGRFLAFGPSASTNDHSALVSGIDAACNGPAKAAPSIDALVASALAGRPLLTSASPARAAFRPFPDFGLYVHARASLWAAVRCGSIGQRGNGGHAHNDQLSVELCLAGVPFFVDPGTGVYTPLPDVRNAFRSTAAHATLVAEPGEQNGWLEGRLGLFSLKRIASFGVQEASASRFAGWHDGFAARHKRTIAIGDRGIEVVDECAAGARMLMLPLAPGVAVVQGAAGECRLEHRGVAARVRAAGRIEAVDARYSPGYGRWVPTKALRITEISPACRWSIELA